MIWAYERDSFAIEVAHVVLVAVLILEMFFVGVIDCAWHSDRRAQFPIYAGEEFAVDWNRVLRSGRVASHW